MPGHEKTDRTAGRSGCGLIVQDPPCYLDRLHIPGYSEHAIAEEDETGADFDPLEKQKNIPIQGDEYDE
jgi:hypothetical protein